jgi:predicted metal-dependent HD superfamily phosphohydrolase
MLLQQTFSALLAQYSADSARINQDWEDLTRSYSEKRRHYHNVQHLENLLGQLLAVQNQVKNWNAVLFALYYHDVIYNTAKQDNEAKSAALAVEKMRVLGVPETEINHCQTIILATQGHQISEDPDTNLFTDADLSILGFPWPQYEQYALQVRREYARYPDFLYKPGRKKVLRHFLQMERIFKTPYFFEQYEAQARQNLERELAEGVKSK